MAGEVNLRVGHGYDLHRLGAGDGIILCGIKLDCDKVAIGHSDADAGLHALVDALLGALGMGDIGVHFPPSDERWKGKDSAEFVKFVMTELKARGGRVVNADITIILEAPKLKGARDLMRVKVAELLEVDEALVNIKATTNEGVDAVGRGEAVVATAVVLIAF